MEKFDPIIEVDDDELYIPTVRAWSLEKYKLTGSYCDIFTGGMKYKWDQLVYIDLFAGAGYARIKEMGRVYKNCVLIALSVPTSFTKYILCEEDPVRFEALKLRVERDYSHLNVELIFGDSNKNIEQVKKAIPTFGKGNTLLPFCFVDPYSLNLKFPTISALAKGLMDFLILQALHMDANRNFDIYMKEESVIISDYLGMANWREVFDKNSTSNKKDFVRFLAEQYQKQMNKLGYINNKQMHQIRSNEKNLPLYYLAFYSKNERGIDFFKQVQKRVTGQNKLEL
jgi:three-Cys-motif partner protein